MPQNLHFRCYTPKDLSNCLAIFDTNCPKFFATHERDAFQKYLQRGQWPYFVVTHDKDQVLACGGYVIGKGVGELAWGMVQADFHRQGIGTFLFTKRLEEIRKAGANEVIMDTSQESLGFYQQLGFQVVSRKPDGYSQGLDRFDLRLDLDKTSNELTGRELSVRG